jgi:hypothetical protein
VPVRIEAAEQAATTEPVVNLQVRLPNGVALDLRSCNLDQVCSVLGGLRCSASTKG